MLALVERTRTDMAGGRVTKMLGQSLYFLTIDKSDLPDDQKRQQKGLDYAEVKIKRDLLRVERHELKTALANERERNASGGFGPIQLKGDWSHWWKCWVIVTYIYLGRPTSL